MFTTYYDKFEFHSVLEFVDGRRLVIDTTRNRSTLKIIKREHGFDKNLYYKVLSDTRLIRSKKTIEKFHRELLSTVDVEYYSTIQGLKNIYESA